MGAQGTAIVNFGAFPGAAMATIAVAGQAAILTTSAVEAWIRPQDATADHSVDEHVAAPMAVKAGSIVAATGFTISCESLNGLLYGTFNLNWVWN